MRFLVVSLVATVIGVAMIVVGVRGVINDVSDDDGSSRSSASALPRNSTREECSQVAERDPRFRIPNPLTFGPFGRAIVQCKGGSVAFTLDLEPSNLKEGTFYEVVLEKGRRELSVGGFLTPPSGIDWTPASVTVGPEVPLKRYDWLTVRENEFHAPKGEPLGEPIRAPL